jgi:uncharacterized membrane protein HdeD (DUF308 family)
MSNIDFFDSARTRFRSSLAEAARKWGWYFALGIFLAVIGAIACWMAVGTTMLSVVILGGLTFSAGAALIVLSFLTGRWSGFLVMLAAGTLIAMSGLAMLSRPLSGALAMTLVVGTILIAAGVYRAVASVVMQFPNWGWSLVSGIVSAGLGTMLLSGWPGISLYFLGLYIGMDLIVHGLSWIMFSLRLHRLAGEPGVGEAERERPAA